MLWKLLLVVSALSPADTLRVVVGNVTCKACAVSLGVVFRQQGAKPVHRDLTPPYARFTLLVPPEKARPLVQQLLHLGYPVYLESEDAPDSVRVPLPMTSETLRVVPAEVWLRQSTGWRGPPQPQDHP